MKKRYTVMGTRGNYRDSICRHYKKKSDAKKALKRLYWLKSFKNKRVKKILVPNWHT